MLNLLYSAKRERYKYFELIMETKMEIIKGQDGLHTQSQDDSNSSNSIKDTYIGETGGKDNSSPFDLSKPLPPPADDAPIVEWAIWAVEEYGFPVFQLYRDSKKPPYGTHGFCDATTDLDQICDWFEVNPDFNYGIYPGADWVVIDIDLKTDKDGNLIDGWAGIQKAFTYPPAVQREGGDYHTMDLFRKLSDIGIYRDTALELAAENWNDRCEPPWDVHEAHHGPWITLLGSWSV